MKKIIALFLCSAVLSCVLFSNSETPATEQNYILRLTPKTEVKGGFCNANSYGVPLSFYDNPHYIDQITLTASESGSNIIFSGSATIAIQIYSSQNIKMKLTGTPFTKQPSRIRSQNIKINTSTGTSSWSSEEVVSSFEVEIPDDDSVLVSEYALMDVEITYSSRITSTQQRLEEVISDYMTLTLEYKVN